MTTTSVRPARRSRGPEPCGVLELTIAHACGPRFTCVHVVDFSNIVRSNAIEQLAEADVNGVVKEVQVRALGHCFGFRGGVG